MKKQISYLIFSLLLIYFCSFSAFSQESNPRQEPHDKFPGVSFKIEKRRLDNAAQELSTYPSKTIYLIVYSSISGKKSDATRRLKKSKKYLKKKHHVASKKIITIYGGTKPEIEMEIFVAHSVPN